MSLSTDLHPTLPELHPEPPVLPTPPASARDRAPRRAPPVTDPASDPSAASAPEAGVAQASRDARMGTILRYKADRRAVAYVMAMFGVHLWIYFTAAPWVAALCVLPLVGVSMMVAPINHHHQHLNTFRSAWLNRLYELPLALQTGIAPYGWVLHHNLGHHVNYLNQRPHDSPDESKWTRRDGSTMGRIEYTIDLVLHHQLDIFRVGRRYPRYWRAFLWMKIPLWSVIALGLYWNPVNAFLAFLLPGFLTLVHTAWVTYGHHAGHHAKNHYEASVNNLNPLFNFLTCNLGYHTAHHKRPGLHWSLLPELHAEIEDRIPAALMSTKF